jgi:hypothetical protein
MRTPQQTQIASEYEPEHIRIFSTSLSAASGPEKHPGVRRPVNIRVCTACSIAATWPILRLQERGQAMLRSAGTRRLREALRRCPAGAKKNSPEMCLVDLGRDTRSSTQSRQLVRRKGASWSLHWPAGANMLAHM